MLKTETILRLLDRRFTIPLMFNLLVVSALLLGDAYSIVFLAEYYGVYMVLAGAATISLLGVLACAALIARRLRLLRRSVYLSTSPYRHYRAVASLICAGLLFLAPGAISSSLALLCTFPIIRFLPGWILTRVYRRELEPVYDYLKMEDAGSPVDRPPNVPGDQPPAVPGDRHSSILFEDE